MLAASGFHGWPVVPYRGPAALASSLSGQRRMERLAGQVFRGFSTHPRARTRTKIRAATISPGDAGLVHGFGLRGVRLRLE